MSNLIRQFIHKVCKYHYVVTEAWRTVNGAGATGRIQEQTLAGGELNENNRATRYHSARTTAPSASLLARTATHHTKQTDHSDHPTVSQSYFSETHRCVSLRCEKPCDTQSAELPFADHSLSR